MTTKSPDRSFEDRRPEHVKAMAKRLKNMSFPNCYGQCPDMGASCPPKEEFDNFLNEHKRVTFNLLPKNWECRTCIYGEFL